MNSQSRALVCLLGMLAGMGPAFGASISSFSPLYAEPGGTTYITINGSGFLGGTLDVRFNGTPAAQAYVSLADGTQIQARIAAGTPTGSGPISVKVGSGTTAYSLENFTVVGPGPYIHSFNPTTGSDNAPVTLTGMHFTGVTNITFAGGRKAIGGVPPTSDSLISVKAPVGVTTGPISVWAVSGLHYTTPMYFYAPPVITSTSLTNGRAGTNFVIRGTNFLGASAVLFAGAGGPYTVPASYTVWSNRAMQVTVPAGAYSGKLRVETPAGPDFTPTNFVIQPLITGFLPGSGGVNTAVLITGANLNVGSPVIRFNGVMAVTNGVSFGQLTAYVPNGATTGPISVQTADGSYTTPNNFYLPPAISSFTPSNSPPGTRITITGQNFTDATSVMFDALPAAAFYVTNNTTIGAVVPAGVSTGPIRVYTPAGSATSAGNFFAPPFIAAFNPTAGVPGTVVTLTGSNFLGTTSVLFNGLSALFTVGNNFSLLATVPDGALTGPITVIAPAGTNTTTSNFTLNYSSDLTVTLNDAPDPVTATSNLVYTTTFGNNGPYAAVNVKLTNALPASVTLISAVSSAGTVQVYSNLVVNTVTNLVVGSWPTLRVTVAPQTAGTIEAVAILSSDYADPNPANNVSSTTTTVLPLALLNIRLVSDRVRVSWPSILDQFYLQSQEPLNPTGTWFNVTTPSYVSGDERVVVETNTGPARFYRLKE